MPSSNRSYGNEPPVTSSITTSGSVQLPPSVRDRWEAVDVLILDRGDYVIVRPIPNSVGALRGSLRTNNSMASDELRRISREQEDEPSPG